MLKEIIMRSRLDADAQDEMVTAVHDPPELDQLAVRIGHPVLAEGVETGEHMNELRRMGCDAAQGYGIARPMPTGEVLGWVADRSGH